MKKCKKELQKERRRDAKIYVINPPDIWKITPIVIISENKYVLIYNRKILITDKNNPKVIITKGSDNNDNNGLIIKFKNPITNPTAKKPQEGAIEKLSVPNRYWTKNNAKALSNTVKISRFIIGIKKILKTKRRWILIFS